ncbi:Uncharacterised protein [Mycoplasmopsis citelli]|uniref:PDxFFG protein n=1 Tax=Mycoplasmopsis citelli TaxID=171281 RepID=A0A449B2T3_9BACT|nr:PDxFFG protein [Mycoplasmopsis citelli]VEU74893.1 Uncharacterised protein [Mycoplasmopsis citelli]
MKRKLKLSLLQKTLLAVSTVVIGSGATLGAMLAYSNNSDEVLGSYSAIPKNLLKNDYSIIRDENGNLKAKVNIVDPLKQRTVAKMSDDGSQYWFVNDEEHKMNFNEFFNAYYKRFQESFIQEIKYGSFNFYNEYVLAVRPERFLEFSKWFIDNVAWGPDLLTLSSFRIVPGVERRGNSITLGNHTTIHKESSEIKFFPDAFFGVAPIFSSIGGEGNAPDALTETTFQAPVSKFQADGFLENLVKISILKNNESLRDSQGLPLYRKESILSFKNIFFVGKLRGQKVKVLVNKEHKEEYRKYNEELKIYDSNYKKWFLQRNGREPKLPAPNSLFSSIRDAKERATKISAFQNAQNLLFPADITETEFKEKIKEFGEEYKNVSFNDLVEYQITDARGISVNPDDLIESNKTAYLTLDLTDGKSEFTIPLYDGVSSPAQYYAEQFLEQMVNSKIKNFLDFYDVDQYLGKKVYLYQDSDHKVYYSNSVEALNLESKFDENNLKELTIKSFEVKGQVFTVTFEHQDKEQKKSEITETFDALKTDKEISLGDLFRSLKYALGYTGALVPRTLTATPETLTAVDQSGKLLKGLASRKFQIYSDSYNGILDEISQKFPFLLKKQNGPHLVKKIDTNGVYKYTIEEGEYQGFSVDDNIGIPMILANTLKNYKGVSYDFLKYVGAHEYGHHYTLEKGQAIDETDSAVLVGGISVNGGASDSSYYSFKALKNYIEARTNLLVRRVDAQGNPNPRGTFTQFGYIKNDGTHTRWETYDDVWGSKSKDIFNTVKNPDRRFIQTFEGLQETAKRRNIRLGDLFLANSLDSNSGTLNPFIEGQGKVIYNENGQKTFKTISLTQMLSQFKDGQGNPIKFTGTNSSNLQVQPFDFKVNEDGTIKITNVRLKNKDGSPAIKVPLNKTLTPEELQYVNALWKRVNDNIKGLYNIDDADNGWNSSTSSADGKRKIVWKSLLNSVVPKSFFDSIIYRNDDLSNEFNPESNGLLWINGSPNKHINPQRKSNLYYAVKNDNSDSNFDVLNKIFQNQKEDERPEGLGYAGYEAAFYYYGKVLSFVDSKNSPNANYVFPVGATRGLSSSHSITSSLFGTYYQRFFGAENNSVYQPTPSFLISEGFGVSAGVTNKEVDLSKSGVYFVGLDSSNQPILDYSKATQVSKVGYNLLSSSYLTLSQSKLDKSFANNILTATVRNKQLPVFNTLKDMFEFGSVDYSKATYSGDEENEAYNWDINYVKTKFNLDKFKAEVSQEADSPMKNTIVASEQSLANEVMKRFIRSSLFLSIKEFKLKDLEKNKAIFSSDYGMNFLNSKFNESYVKTTLNSNGFKFNIEKFLETIKETFDQYYNKTAKGQYESNAVSKAFENISLNDLFMLLGNVLIIQSDSNNTSLANALFLDFTDGTPSSDAIDYFNTKNEPQIADKFTDYVYTMPETLTRDYVQTTFVPSNNDFGNLPTYLSNVSEANTGLDYVNDISSLSIWNERINSKSAIVNGIETILLTPSKPHEYFAKRSEIQQKYQKLALEADAKISQFEKSTPEELKLSKEEYALQLNALQTQKQEINFDKNKELSNLLKLYDYDITLPDIQQQTRIKSSYFGKLKSNNNGYFKDKWEKESIGIELYDPTTGDEIIDNTIRLLDLDGKKVTSRPRAFFLSQLYNYGVGDRTVSGIYRNKDFDALALYGYVKNEDAAKIDRLKFTNIKTGEAKYLHVNVDKTNNIFYLKKQADPTSKVTLKDEGYSTWISDYALMGKYRDALLFPGNSFTIDFVDKDGNELKDKDGKSIFTLGHGQSLTENGKDDSNAPIKISAKGKDKNNKEIDKAVIEVDLQFNVIR